MGGPQLRTLDSLHLVTAVMAEAGVVVAYDRRLAEAARDTGFDVATPR